MNHSCNITSNLYQDRQARHICPHAESHACPFQKPYINVSLFLMLTNMKYHSKTWIKTQNMKYYLKPYLGYISRSLMKHHVTVPWNKTSLQNILAASEFVISCERATLSIFLSQLEFRSGDEARHVPDHQWFRNVIRSSWVAVGNNGLIYRSVLPFLPSLSYRNSLLFFFYPPGEDL